MQEYLSIDQDIHQLAQIIAKFNRTLVSEKKDDSHTNLSFDALHNSLHGRWAENNGTKFILSLNLGEFAFQLRDFDRNLIKPFPVEGSTYTALEKTIAGYLPEAGFDSEGFLDDLHYEIPRYDLLDKPYKKWSPKALELWVTYRSMANTSAYELLDALQIRDEVRIWPHHFDTGIYVEASSFIGLGFGLAIKDDMVGEPYFYFSGYGLNEYTIDYSKTRALTAGKWILTDHWKGAVLCLSEASPASLITFQQEVLKWFLLKS
ncbi:MAG: hypothetical protein ACNA8K_07735 [Cyclonatronaceae bacterium]